MRKLLPLLLLLFASPAWATWSLHNSATGSGSGNNLATGAFSGALANPSIIVVFADKDGTTAYSGVPTDTAGNTYVDCGGGAVLFSASSAILQCWYTNNTHTTASNIVTTHTTDSPGFPSVVAAEFTGGATASPVDVHKENPNATNSSPGYPTNPNGLTSTAATTTQAGDLIVAFLSPSSGPTHAGSSPNTFTEISTVGGESEYFVQSSAGSIAATAGSNTGADPYGALMVAFKAASSSAAPGGKAVIF